MPTKQEMIEERTHPYLETAPRVFQTIIGEDKRESEAVQHRTAKALALLVARLEKGGVLSASDIDDVLLETAL